MLVSIPPTKLHFAYITSHIRACFEKYVSKISVIDVTQHVFLPRIAEMVKLIDHQHSSLLFLVVSSSLLNAL